MAHTTPGGMAFIKANAPFTGLVGGHVIANGVAPVGSTQFPSLLGIDFGSLFDGDCPPGQVDVPLLGCVDINPFDDDPPSANGCNPGFVPDGIGGCVATDPTGPPISPTERGAVADGPALPSRVARNVHVCPKFVDGSTGILYFSPLTNQIVCLPRSMSPKSALAFGLLRKNKARAKALVTAADGRLLSKISSIQGKIGTLAAKAEGLSCPPKKKR